MDFDGNLLMASLLFGTIGMGMLMFGKKSGRTMPLIAGLGLLTLPYFITSIAVMMVVCLSLTASPWIIREG
jgi:hypothetical protein